MAQLPKIQPNNSLTVGPRSRLTAADIANPYQQIAAVLGDVSQVVRAKELDDAQAHGENAVFRTPDGQLQVSLKSNSSRGGRTYNRAAMQSYMARLAGDVRAKGASIADEAKGDPSVFSGAWKGFQDEILKAAPRDLRGAARTLLETEGQRFGLGVSEAKRTRDLKIFEGNIKAEVSALDDEMSALAQKGGTGTDAYREKQAQLQTLMGELVANPDFTLGDKEAALQIKRMESRHMGYALIGKVDGVLNTQGVAAARKMAESVLTDTGLDLSPSERRSFSAMMDERINGAMAVRKAELEPVKEQAKSIKERLKLGVGIDGDDVDQTARALARGGDAAGAWELVTARASARSLSQFRNMSSKDQVAELEKAKGGVAPANSGTPQIRAPANVREAISSAAQKHGVSPTALMKIAQIESSMNPKAKNPNSSAGGLFQFIDGTAADYGLQDRYDAGQASDAAARLMKDNANHLRGVLGREPTDGELYLAHQQGAGGAAKLLSDPGARAADIVGADAVRLNGGSADMTAGEFAQKWISKADGTSPDYSAMDIDLVKEMQTEVTADAKSLFSDMQDGLAKSYAPAPEEIQLLSRQLSMVDDEDFRSEVRTFFESEAAAASLAQMPEADRTALMDALDVQAAEGMTIAQQEMLSAMERTHEATQKAIAEDPIGYAAQRKMAAVPQPLNFTNTESMIAGFTERQRAVDALGASGTADGVSALRPSDIKDMQAFMSRATVQEQADVLHSMGQALKPETMAITAQKLAGKDGTNGFAMAGALYADNPEAAEGVLRGYQLLQANPKLAPKDDDTFKTVISENVPMSGFAVGFESDRQSLIDAAKARYADLSARVGDESQVINETRYEQAVRDVTGGFVSHNGEQILTPVYGMGQDEFDALLQTRGAQALAGAVTEEGAPITLQNVLEEAKLKAIGPGEYLVEFAGQTYARAKMDRMESDGGYQPFILDLRGV